MKERLWIHVITQHGPLFPLIAERMQHEWFHFKKKLKFEIYSLWSIKQDAVERSGIPAQSFSLKAFWLREYACTLTVIVQPELNSHTQGTWNVQISKTIVKISFHQINRLPHFYIESVDLFSTLYWSLIFITSIKGWDQRIINNSNMIHFKIHGLYPN